MPSFQVAGLVFILAGSICAFAGLGDAGLKYTHGQFGLAIFILAFLQPLLGLLRPNKGDSKRGAWYAAHWLVGVSLVIMAWVNVYLGADLFNYIFGANVQVRRCCLFSMSCTSDSSQRVLTQRVLLGTLCSIGVLLLSFLSLPITTLPAPLHLYFPPTLSPTFVACAFPPWRNILSSPLL